MSTFSDNEVRRVECLDAKTANLWSFRQQFGDELMHLLVRFDLRKACQQGNEGEQLHLVWKISRW
jgi:hypothetical protein